MITLCLENGCTKPSKTRGLCEPHYKKLQHLVFSRKLDDFTEAERLGLCLVPQPRAGSNHPWRKSYKGVKNADDT